MLNEANIETALRVRWVVLAFNMTIALFYVTFMNIPTMLLAVIHIAIGVYSFRRISTFVANEIKQQAVEKLLGTSDCDD